MTPPGVVRLAALIARARLRGVANAVFRVPRRRSLRLAWLMVLLGPIGYVGLFAAALDVVAGVGARAEQEAMLALVALSVMAASAAGKMAASEAVVGGSGENEFLLSRPVALPALVVARSLSGVVTDLFDALFLFPALAAAALVWGLGAPGVLLAALCSVIAQVGVSAAAQAGQILVVRAVPPAGRRAAWAALALFAALTLACLWVVATWVLRRPAALVEALRPAAGALLVSPGGAVVLPLRALAGGGSAAAALLAPALVSAVAVLAAALAARWAGRAGWEQAGQPWAESGARPRRGGFVTPLTKDLRLLVRDRARLVSLGALPLIFVGIQVFGSAGWQWTAADPRHVALLAFSLAAYLATFGPLGHMDAERRAFWLLCVAPVPLGRLLAWKAAFWALVVGGVALLAHLGVIAAAGLPLGAQALRLGALVLVGAVAVSWLAVGMAAGVADFSDDRRAVGLGTVYLFLLVAGLYNLVLLGEPALQARALALYLGAVALHWMAGVDRAARVFDPPDRGDRAPVAADGATLSILLFLGARAHRLAASAAAGAPIGAWAQAIWPGLLGLAAPLYLPRRTAAERRSAWGAAALIGGLLAAGWRAPMAAALVGPLVQELALRGLVQPALAGRWPSWRGRLVAVAVAAALGAASLEGPWSVVLPSAVLPGAAALVLGLPGALIARGLLVLASWR